MDLKITHRILALVLSMSAPVAALAAQHHAGMPGMESGSQTERSPLTEGEVRKVDQDQGKITIKHGPLENLGMPGMTMVFRVADPAMLSKVKQGDAIKFSAERVDGAFTVTKLELSK